MLTTLTHSTLILIHTTLTHPNANHPNPLHPNPYPLHPNPNPDQNLHSTMVVCRARDGQRT